jgi:hypothetical protein
VSSSGEVPVSEDERRVCGRTGQESGSYGVLALVLATSGAERAESRGVATALGREVAAEAEHVSPGGQPEVFELGELAETGTVDLKVFPARSRWT